MYEVAAAIFAFSVCGNHMGPLIGKDARSPGAYVAGSMFTRASHGMAHRQPDRARILQCP